MFTLGTVAAFDASLELTGVLGATELGASGFKPAVSGAAVLGTLTTDAGVTCGSVLPSLRACTPRSSQTPTAAHTVASTTTVNARNANAARIELSRATNADLASNPFGAGCTRSQISGGSLSVLTTAELAAARATALETGSTSRGGGPVLSTGGAGFSANGTGLSFGGAGFSSSSTTSLNVRAVAHMCGDVPCLVDACESAPCSINALTTSVCPKNAASANAVNLSFRVMFASAPRPSSTRTTLKRPCCAARINAVTPCALRALISLTPGSTDTSSLTSPVSAARQKACVAASGAETVFSVNDITF